MKTWWQRKTIGIDGMLMWVLGLLVVGVFLLWATAGRAFDATTKKVGGTVWAWKLGSGQFIDTDSPCLVGEAAFTNHDRLIQCVGKEWREVVLIPTTCEQRMEVVMRVMDGIFREIDTNLSMELLVLIRPDVREQWGSAKRECWRKP